MASTFDNDLRLEEMATGENAGSWGTKTNTNLELIADAFGYGTFTIADADTTLTMPDGSDTDNALRSLYLKISSSADLTTTRTLTLAPNTVSKLWYIENNTSGGQTITISQGSGANVSILNGQAKLVATDGAGAGAAVIDVTQDLAIPDLFIDDDLSLQSDGAVINFGEDADVNLTHVADTGLRLNDAMALEFRDGDLSINSSADGQLDIDADTEVQITAPTVDIDASTEVNISGDLKVDTDTLYVDSTNNRVNVGNGRSSATAASNADDLVVEASGDGGISILNPASNTGTLFFGDPSGGNMGQIKYSHSADSMSFVTAQNTAFVIDSNRRVLVGHGQNVGNGSDLQVTGSDFAASSISVARYSNNSSSTHFLGYKSRSGTVGSAGTVVEDDDNVLILRGYGDDGTDILSTVADIYFQVDGTPGANDMPGRIVFSTTSDGASTSTERMRIDSAGNVGIGVIPKTGGTTWQHIQFGGTGNLVSRFDDAIVDAMFASNYYVNASNVDSYITTGAAARMFFNDNTISFDQAASGTAGTAITWSEAMRIDSSQRVLIGLTSARTEFFDSGVAPLLQVQDTGSNAAIGIIRTDTSADGPSLLFGRSHGTGYGIVNNGDRLGRIPFQGADGVDFEQSSSIDAYVDGTPGVQDMPGRMVFSVTPDGTNATVEVLRISSNRTTKISTGQNMGGLTTFPSYSGEGAYLKGYVNGGGAGPYPRYLDIAAVGDSSWGGVIRFLGNKDATATAVENARIDRDGHLKIGTVSGAGKLTVSNTQTAVDNFELAAFSGSDVNQRLTVNNYFCGSDEDRVGLLFENQGTINMRVWMGDDGKLYSSASNPTSDNSGNYFVQVDSSGNIAMPSGKGIDFSATGNSSGGTTSEVFHDYEEGTWTPVYTTAGGGQSVTYTNQYGIYTKIGNLVTIHFNLDIASATNIGSGDIVITGLPYATGSTASTSNYNRSTFSTYGIDYDSTDGHQMHMYLPTTNVTKLQILYSRDNAAWTVATTSNFNIGTGRSIIVMGSLSYYTDS